MERLESQGFPVRWLISFLISPVASEDGRISGSGVARDLAVGGCTVVSDTRVSPGVQMELRLYLPEEVMPVDVDRAVVRRAKGRKFRLEFITVHPEARERLHRFVGTPQ